VRVSTINCRTSVQQKANFKAANVYGLNIGDLYVVYSYGTHWPLFIFDRLSGKWFENEDRYSTTTSKHRTQAHPLATTEKRSLTWMKSCVDCGGEALLEEHRALAALPLC
jgi:hypothetical protein